MSEEDDDVDDVIKRDSCGAEFTLLIGQASCLLPGEVVDSVTKRQHKIITTQYSALIQTEQDGNVDALSVAY